MQGLARLLKLAYHLQIVKSPGARSERAPAARKDEQVNTGPRKTRQREAIREVFERSERPLTIEELVSAAGTQTGGIGIATAYRAVAALLKESWLETVEIPGEPVRYERAGKEHHHHFRCEKCDRVFDVGGCLENLRKLVPPRFRVKAHAVTLYGLCSACAS
jgi:Fur family ferric uptake transcriptional regulator